MFNDCQHKVNVIEILRSLWMTKCRHKKKSHKTFVLQDFGGERGIRTPGTSQYNGFQDRLVMTTSIPLHN